MALELLVSTEKYENRIAMLESYLSALQNIAAEYESLQGQVNSFMDSDDHMGAMQQQVRTNIQRVNNAIEATQTAISTLQSTVATMSNASQNVSTIIQAGINAASTLL